MDDVLKLLRNRFTMNDLMHLSDIDDEDLKLMMLQNGPSRDEFIKFLVYTFLLDVDPGSEDSQKHNLEKIFVSFGIMDKMKAQQFLKGSLPIELHTTIWKKIIETLIPNTYILTKYSYTPTINMIYEKYDHYQSLKTKNFLPPELVSKLESKTISNENDECIEDSLEKLNEILKNCKISDEISDNKINSELDLMSIEKEIDQHNTKHNTKNKIVLSNSEQSNTLQEFIDVTNDKNLTDTDYLESKVDNIYKLIKVDQDLQTLANSLAEQI